MASSFCKTSSLKGLFRTRQTKNSDLWQAVFCGRRKTLMEGRRKSSLRPLKSPNKVAPLDASGEQLRAELAQLFPRSPDPLLGHFLKNCRVSASFSTKNPKNPKIPDLAQISRIFGRAKNHQIWSIFGSSKNRSMEALPWGTTSL